MGAGDREGRSRTRASGRAPSGVDAALPPVPLARLALLIDSHRRLTGRPLPLGPDTDPARALWASPVAVVAHGTQADPVFFYGNSLALRCFEIDFDRFARMPSRLSAEPMEREARDRLLARVRERGWVDDYAGVRVSATGRRFRIERATVWNLVDARGRHHGQAAAFPVPAEATWVEGSLP